ncbi:MAG: type II toxin-antitoxin system Phd/YefM family antitoxin [Candidatus Dormibacteraceae bacterium]
MQVNMHQAKTTLSQLVEAALRGEPVTLARYGKPVVDIVPHRTKLAPRQGGQWRGKAWISPDFDAPMPEIEELFYS